MRTDMSKVIVERPRYDGYEPKNRRFSNLLRDDPDEADLPAKVPLRDRNRRTKELNENLQPLIRYLQRQIGRPWNKVRSEMSESIALNSAVQKHILDHVSGFVELNVSLIDDVPCTVDGRPVARFSRSALYVCPKSGLLKRAKPVQKRPEAPLRVKQLDRNRAAIYFRNCWHEAVLKPAYTFYSFSGSRQPVTRHGGRVHDAILGEVWNSAQLDALWGKSGGTCRYAESLRPMTRAEIRMLP